MDFISYDAESLIGLLGLNRSDIKLENLLTQFENKPIFTVVKEAGANEEIIEFKDYGFGLCFHNDKLISISLHSGENGSGYSRYSYSLPTGFCFEQSKPEIFSMLGQPNMEGGGKDGLFGPIPVWIKYKMDNYTLHIEFSSESKGVKMVTIMTL